jgi:hypothetical protein
MSGSKERSVSSSDPARVTVDDEDHRLALVDDAFVRLLAVNGAGATRESVRMSLNEDKVDKTSPFFSSLS